MSGLVAAQYHAAGAAAEAVTWYERAAEAAQRLHAHATAPAPSSGRSRSAAACPAASTSPTRRPASRCSRRACRSMAETIVSVFQSYRAGSQARTTDAVRALTGREPGAFARFAHDHAALFGAEALARSAS